MTLKISDITVPPGHAPGPGQVTMYQKATAFKPEVGNSHDLQRVLNLPRRPQPSGDRAEALVQHMTDTLTVSHPTPCNCRSVHDRDCITRLNLSQSWALFELSVYGGLLGGIGVGHGKTILGILTPLVVHNCKTALILVPPKLVDQLVAEYQLIAQHFRVPSLVVHNAEGRTFMVPGAPVLHVMPYSRLCRATAADFIRRLNPDLILADEVHKLKDLGTATAARVDRHMEQNPATRFAGWTGSLTDKSLNDYGHIAKWALKDGSPLPTDSAILDDWARAIDPSDFPAPPGALLAMCEPGEHIHKGYHRRLVETPGVVITKKSAIDAALVITKRKTPPMPDVVKDALASIRDFVRPDGEELVEAYEVAMSARQAACGFYYRWKFVNGETEDQIEKWLAVRKEWNRELRNKLAPRAEYLDSPYLCEQAAERFHGDIDPTVCPQCLGGILAPDEGQCIKCLGTGRVQALPVWESEFYKPWQAIKDTVNPVTEAVRFSPYLAQDAAEWGHSHRGVIWYSYNAFGEWISEISGLPLHGGGPNCDKRIAREKGDRSIVASIQAHGTGRDGLQRIFSDQLITTPPSSATTWEQLLGRLHRLGQKSNKVTGSLYLHTDEFRSSLAKATTRSLYVETTLGAAQKMQAAIDF